MDEELREPVRPARWLAWVVAGLLTAGVISAGTVSGEKDAADRRIVTAAGGRTGGVELPPVVADPEPTTTLPAPPPSTTTTAAPKPTATTTQPPRTTTTKAPTPSTTAPAPAGTTLTVVNEHSFAVVAKVNGKTFQVAPGQQSGPTAITRSTSGNDVVEVTLAQEPMCGTGDADSYFPAAGAYRMTVSASPGLCESGVPGPKVVVTPA